MGGLNYQIEHHVNRRKGNNWYNEINVYSIGFP
jgi:hypothetical protein